MAEPAGELPVRKAWQQCVNMVALLELVEGVEALTVYAHY